ncbi:MAG TPA: type II toxin-antitoxin system VapC family toxin [Bryobacteraceae bacterium]|nr:type II toxin-antitoxin system VapC family toxin [Bryobacteraceae bacterium]
MVVDTSALVAILQAEPERDPMLAALARDPRRLISALTVIEAGMVLEGRYGADARADLELFIFDARLEIVPLDARQAETALRAWRRYGKGRHIARLNLGDCCTYALAKATGEPILAKGNHFPQTDISVWASEAGTPPN